MSITISDDNDFQCPICLQNFENRELIIKMNCCEKFLHKSCMNEWRKQNKMKQSYSCVLCRKFIPTSTFKRLPIYDINEEEVPIYNEANNLIYVKSENDKIFIICNDMSQVDSVQKIA